MKRPNRNGPMRNPERTTCRYVAIVEFLHREDPGMQDHFFAAAIQAAINELAQIRKEGSDGSGSSCRR